MTLTLRILVIVLLFVTTSVDQKLFGQDYFTNYPVNCTIGNNGSLRRLELSVYDSVLQSVVNYNTPWISQFIIISGISPGKITFTVHNTPVDPPIQLNAVIYDMILHQFVPDSHTFNVSSSLRKNVVCGPIWVEYYYETDQGNGNTINSYAYSRYNMMLHKWVKISNSLTYRFSTTANFYSPIQIGNSDRLRSEDNHLFYYYDPISDVKYEYTREENFILDMEIEEQDNLYGNLNFNPENIQLQTYDPDYHQLVTFPRINIEPSFHDGVYIAFDINQTNDYFFTTYDIEQHQWVTDSVSTLFISHLTSKNRIISYISQHSGTKMLYAMAYNQLLHQWVKDSVIVSGGVSNLNISTGTINYTDAAGPHVLGYDPSMGWGNYSTTKMMYFILKDYTNSGYPFVYVKNYSLGTDSVYFDFGDGTVSGNNRDVFWHHFVKSGTYNICIYDSSGTQSYCSPVTLNLCNFTGIATCISDTICAGDSVQLSVTGTFSGVQWQYRNGTIWTDISLPGSDQPNFNMLLDSTMLLRAKLTGVNCTPSYSNSLSILVYRTIGTPVISDTLISKCSGSSALISVIGTNPGINLTWQFSDDGTNWFNFAFGYIVSCSNDHPLLRCKLTSGNCFVDSSLISHQLITPLPPSLPLDTFERCGAGPIQLTANASGTALWYNNSMSHLLGIGDTIITNITATAYYNLFDFDGSIIASGYADPSIGTTTIGILDSISLRFQTNEPVNLLSIKVFPIDSGNIYCKIVGSNGIIFKYPYSIPVVYNPTGTTIEINADLPGDGTYDLFVYSATTPIRFQYNTSGITYPLTTPGSSVSIVGYSDTIFHSTPDLYPVYDLIFAEGCKSPAATILAKVYPPFSANISSLGPFKFCIGDSVSFTAFPANAINYAWLRNGDVIPGATSNKYTAFIHGQYEAMVSSLHCVDTSNSMTVRTPCSHLFDNEEREISYQNQSGSQCYIELNTSDQTLVFHTELNRPQSFKAICIDAIGKILFSETIVGENGIRNYYKSIAGLKSGMYIVVLSLPDGNCTLKFVVEN